MAKPKPYTGKVVGKTAGGVPAPAKKKRGNPNYVATTGDKLKYGPDIAKLKQQLVRQGQWGADVLKPAKARGVTVAGYLSGAPGPLQERRPDSLAAQARSTINSAYKPVEQQYNRQQVRIDALAAKRKADEQQFQQWLSGEFNRLGAQASAADQTMVDRQSQIYKDAAAAMQQITAQSQQNAAATASVSNPAQSTPLNDVSKDQQQLGLMANSRNDALSQAASGANTAKMMDASMLAQAAANAAKIGSDTAKSSNELADARSKTASEKATALIGDKSRLQQQEISKASTNQDYKAASAALGLKQTQTRYDYLLKNRELKQKDKALSIDQWKAKHQALTDKLKIQVDYDKIAAQNGRDAANRALDKAIADQRANTQLTIADQRTATQKQIAAERAKSNVAAGIPKGATAGQVKNSQHQYEVIEDARSRIDRMIGNNVKDIRGKLMKQGYSNVVIDLAWALRNDGHLDKRNQQRARAIGVLNAHKLWPGA